MRPFSVSILLSTLMYSGAAWGSDAAETSDVPALAACETGNANLCYDGALDLYRGHSGTQDKAGAHNIFAKLCEGGMAKACHAAAMYVSRYSETRDFEKSLYFQSKGCEDGLAQSCHVMGRNYDAPWETDIQADHDKARTYFAKACDHGFGLSCSYAKSKVADLNLE